MTKRSLLIALAITIFTIACGARFTKKGGTQAPAAAAAAATTTQSPVASGYPTTVAPAARNYPSQQLDARTGLNGMGQWTTIGDQQFFMPDLAQVEDGQGWEPYQQGRWTYDNQRGWTWVSQEPWGWMTDHYGVWRHHRTHGWVWMPFHDMHYEPHCVTWFDKGDNIGWYPYHADYKQAYALSDRHGFDDGYWRGREAVLSITSSGSSFHFGFTLVHRSHATDSNIRRRIYADRNFVLQTAYAAHRGDGIQRVGRYPGGDRSRSHKFVQSFNPQVLAPVGDAQEVRSRGGARFLQPFTGKRDDRRDSDRTDEPRGGDSDRRRENVRREHRADRAHVPQDTSRSPDPQPVAPAAGVDKKNSSRGRPTAQPENPAPKITTPATIKGRTLVGGPSIDAPSAPFDTSTRDDRGTGRRQRSRN